MLIFVFHGETKKLFKHILLAIVLIDLRKGIIIHPSAQHNTLNLMKTNPDQKLFLHMDSPDCSEACVLQN